MLLADRDIQTYVKQRKIKIEPVPDWTVSLGSCSVDLRLGEVEVEGQQELIQAEGIYRLRKGDFVLATTLEYIELPADICGMLHGRSSWGRRGLMVHSTAALIDAGFRGRIVLELFHAGTEAVVLHKADRICALSFEQLSSPAAVPYYKKKGAKYLNQKHPGV